MSEREEDATRPIGPSRPLPPPPEPPGRSRRHFPAALGLTVLGALVPGTAFLAAGRRRLGAVTLLGFLLLVAGVVWLAGPGRRTAARIAVDSTSLTWVLAGVVVVALLWTVVVVAGYRVLVPPRTSRGQHLVGAVVVLALLAGLAVPAATVVGAALAQRGLLAALFGDHESATVVDRPDPFGDKARVNVLLLGGDGGEGREGVRTDTVIVASIDTDTGDTTLFSLPRNLEDLPFPPGSPLAEVYPDGFDAGSESESLLNAVYRNGPGMYPDILGPTDDPGADFLKLGVGEALGLTIDYYVLVNLDGFARLVDALGGITVNVNYYVPVNGDPGTGELPDDYIAPGPHQHLDGYLALQFARGRYGLTDYDRMARQRCTIAAIIDAADPVTLLRKYQQLAATTQDIVRTDVPRSALDDFVDLGFLVKDAEVRSVVFDTSVIDPAYPDYAEMRAIVSEAIAPAADGAATTPAADHAAATTPAADHAAATTPAAAPAVPSGQTPAPATTTPIADVGDACAYDPALAQAALAAGEPPNKAG
ncbi:LytR family transcriptional regulator [Geodermatophilus sp. TF02-6]|uniref:LCP family protein n=1 Tax=Geodermatophilus sp. TF02-6 TaxID=2250575 RepID=UPI000DE939B8|nr:LCP family protein [Geodermatophilus sp. TF02-6]RBY75543.1 LytR family transcriptional regulator [Geodermatophilus sp. TF02-6]